jgi:hypothetical protein
VVYGDGTSTGLYLMGAATAFALATSCAGYRATNNVNRNHVLGCAGDAGNCTNYCTAPVGTIRLCDLAVDPGWANPELCLLPAFNDLIDAGLDLGYDLLDDGPPLFFGSAPDVGAREAGTSRRYGAYLSTCP